VPGHLVTATFGGPSPQRAAEFWAALLHRQVVEDPYGWLVAGAVGDLPLRFSHGDGGPKTRRNRMHLHLTSTSTEHQQQTVETALRLGGQHLDVGQREDEGHVVLADPGGNEFCVIEPGNRWLAGCGFLGELACDGSRAVGVFWSEALGWPLVWDQDDETAIRSPQGDYKIAWGGASPAGTMDDRAAVDLTTYGDPGAERDRLVQLGATVLDVSAAATVLADPDGFPLRLLTTGESVC
jgi:hypothetical protein